MRVLIIANWYNLSGEPAGAGEFHHELAMVLKEHCETALYFPFDTKLPCSFMSSIENGLLTFRSRSTDFTGKKSYLINFRAFSNAMDNVVRNFAPDVIHANCVFAAGMMAVLYGKTHGIPVIITEHAPLEMLPIDSKIWKRVMARAYRHADADACVSPHLKSELEGTFPGTEFELIYNGTTDPETMPADGNSYRIYGVTNCSIVASFYNKDVKGMQFLLPAVKQLRDEGTELALHIIGGGEFLEYYRQMAEKLAIGDVCVFYGQCGREKVYSIVKQMDFCVSASLFESAGVAAQEAMLLGKPMVVTKSGGTDSLVTEETAIVVEKGSVQALRDGLTRMKDHLSEYDPEEIKKYARENFSMDAAARKNFELYCRILKQ